MIDKYYIWSGETEPFQMFGNVHYTTIFILVSLYLTMILLGRRIAPNGSMDQRLRTIFAGILIAQEITLNIFRVTTGIWSVAESLPLHLCSFSVILSAILMWNKSAYLFDILFYWSAGAFMAILTPDLQEFSFPHFRYYQFFLSHGMIIFTIVYFMSVHQYKPRVGSLKRTLIFTNVLLPIIGVVNWITGGNYFFVAHKPETASLIDFLGPWPWYLVSLEGVLFTIFGLMYLPFYLKQKQYFSKTA